MSAEIDIFISYVREERHLADLYANALIDAGYTVVTDLDIEKGADFGEVIDGMILAARLVVVLWTHKSAQSRWVRIEAVEAFEQGKYYPVGIDAIDRMEIPVQVRGRNWLDVSTKDRNEGVVETVSDIGAKIGLRGSDDGDGATRSAAAGDDMELYRTIHAIGESAGYREYLKRFPMGIYAETAKRHLGWPARMRRRLPSAAAVVAAATVAGVAATHFLGGSGADQTALDVLQAERDGAISALSEAKDDHATAIANLKTAHNEDKRVAVKQAKQKAAGEIDRLTAEMDSLGGQITALIGERDEAIKVLDAERAKHASALLKHESEANASRNAAISATRSQVKTAFQVMLRDQTREAAKVLAATKTQYAADLQEEREANERRVEALQTEIKKLRPFDPSTLSGDALIAYRLAEERIAQAKEEGWKHLNLSGSEYVLKVAGEERRGSRFFRSLTVLPDSIGSLEEIVAITMFDTSLENIEPLSDIKSLEILDLASANISSTISISGLTSIKWLSISKTRIKNLDGIKNISKLETLHIKNLEIESLSPLKNLTSLTEIYINNSSFPSLSPLSDIQSLRGVYLSGAAVDNLSALKGIDQLHYILPPTGSGAGSPFYNTPETRAEVAAAIANWKP